MIFLINIYGWYKIDKTFVNIKKLSLITWNSFSVVEKMYKTYTVIDVIPKGWKVSKKIKKLEITGDLSNIFFICDCLLCILF